MVSISRDPLHLQQWEAPRFKALFKRGFVTVNHFLLILAHLGTSCRRSQLGVLRRPKEAEKQDKTEALKNTKVEV